MIGGEEPVSAEVGTEVAILLFAVLHGVLCLRDGSVCGK
jgi:Protein of unknown function (DUF3467)